MGWLFCGCGFRVYVCSVGLMLFVYCAFDFGYLIAVVCVLVVLAMVLGGLCCACRV